MKKIIYSLLSIAMIVTVACTNNDNAIDPETQVDVGNMTGEATEAGKPIGAPVSATIGPQGGNLVVANGKLTVEIPAGALEKTETIRVQMVESTVPGGAGLSFVIEPRDLKLKKPVFYSWNYGTGGVNGSAPEATGIAYQKPDGVWMGKTDMTVDEAKRTIKASLPDFKYPIAFYEQFFMAPLGGALLPNERLQLTVYFEPNRVEGGKVKNDLVIPIATPRKALDAMDVKNWMLNGIRSLSDEQRDIMGSLDPLDQGAEAIFVAPKAVPRAYNPEAVSVELNLKQRGKIILVSNLQIEDPKNEFTLGGMTIDNPKVQVVTEGGGLSFVMWQEPKNPGDHQYSLSGSIAPNVFKGTGNYVIKGHEWGHSYVNVGASDPEDSYAPRWIPSPSVEEWGPGSIGVTIVEGDGKPVAVNVQATLHTYLDKEKTWKHVQVKAHFKVISNYHAGSGG